MATFLGRFAWHDLVTPDVDGAVAFYKAVVGWDTRAFDGGDKPYMMWVTPGGKPVGGVVALSDEMKTAGARPHWFAHIATPDLAATLEKARGLGARVIWEPEAVPTVGQFAIMLDPEGVDFAAFQPEAEAPGHDGQPALGEFGWHELMHANPEAAWDFYTPLFDWVERGVMDMGEMGTYRMFGQAHTDTHFGAMMRTPPDAPFASWLHYTRVADVHGAMAAATERGATVIVGPMEVPGGDIIVGLLDPFGAAFAVYGPKPVSEG